MKQPTKAIRIQMTYRDGKIYHWTVRRAPTLRGWEYTDHEGYTRFAQGNWLNLVSRFRATAANYGMSCEIS